MAYTFKFTTPVVRKNIRDLTNTEKQNFITAIKAIKAEGSYDVLVKRHVVAAARPTPSTVDPYYRNAAHNGPAFHPWHRFFLHRLEILLQRKVPGVAIPYWDWTQDAADPRTSPVWASDFLGGDGDPNDGWLVKTGPLAVGQWTIVNENGQPAGGLRRQFGINWPTSPTQDEVNISLQETNYDSSSWDTSSSTSYRNRSEGWLGVQLHNKAHGWIGGSMLPMTSPNDPVFFLHHCNVDRLWAKWQELYPNQGYEPVTGGPNGHNLNDQMHPWDAASASALRVTPADVLNYKALGYIYA